MYNNVPPVVLANTKNRFGKQLLPSTGEQINCSSSYNQILLHSSKIRIKSYTTWINHTMNEKAAEWDSIRFKTCTILETRRFIEKVQEHIYDSEKHQFLGGDYPWRGKAVWCGRGKMLRFDNSRCLELGFSVYNNYIFYVQIV